MLETSLLIGSGTAAAASGRTFDRANPVSGEIVTRSQAAGVEDAVRAVEAAASAFEAWAATTPSTRRMLLLKAADLLEASTERFVERMAAECGATAGWGHFNAHLAAGILREAAGLTTSVGGQVIPSDVPGSLSMGIRQPAGVVVGMAPWNAPVILSTRAVAFPLAAGNTVVLKCSELSPGTHMLLGEILLEAGFPAGVVNVITVAPEDAADVTEAMVAHPAVRRLNFTGSTRVGRIIGEVCARHLVPAVLELGGKNPLVVLDDADIDAAVQGATFGGFVNQGHVCMSTDKIIVDESIADEFVAKLVARVESLPVGDPREGDVVLGSVIGQSTVDHIQRLVDDAVAKGAKVLTSGEPNGTIMPGVVLDHVTPDMEIFSEEIFGPAVTITRVSSEDEAIAKANDSAYGLSAAVFTRDAARGFQVARRIESGICHINAPTVHDEAQMPFGGVKDSGYGRFGGQAGIDAFTELRWISMQVEPRVYPF
ncbi:salicylaldehyde dehydrogenase [Blastococcus sp. TF02-8]|uniref:aldehyde dehydrogenase n=1 Tax=Blastococcus sp. TF02-8 TaxID=2250574 RepID=UPI000DE8E476|nr:aldehyde dehydrogenase [Blastococcus sp. TF02-8]RBY95426.1 salicylaldehyde dehydrogenase [Blastococcus sp. TF02-8]